MSEAVENVVEVGTSEEDELVVVDPATAAGSNTKKEPTISQILQSVMEARKPFKKEEKISLLNDFIRVADLASLHKSKARPVLIEIQKSLKASKGKNNATMNRNWNTHYMASKIAEIHCTYTDHCVEMKKLKSTRVTLRNTQPRTETIRFLDKFKDKCDGALEIKKAEMEADKLANAKKAQKRVTASKRKTGKRLQDGIEFDPAKLEPEKCPACKQFCCMALESKETIKEQQALIDAEHDKKVRRFNTLKGVEKQTATKPRKPPSKQQTIGCFCHTQHCMGRPDGGSCFKCREFAAENVVFLIGNGKCICDICNSSCSLTFGRSQRTKIAAEHDVYNRNAIASDGTPANASQFLNLLQDAVVQETAEQFKKNPTADPESNKKDACANVFLNMVTNEKFASAGFRRMIRKSTGPISRVSSDGLSMDQIRERNKGTKRSLDGNRIYQNNLLSPAEPITIDGGWDSPHADNTGPGKSHIDPIVLDGVFAESQKTPDDTKLPALLEETPDFLRKIRLEGTKKAILGVSNTPNTKLALDEINRSLHASAKDQPAINLKNYAKDVHQFVPDNEKALGALIDYSKRRKEEA